MMEISRRSTTGSASHASAISLPTPMPSTPGFEQLNPLASPNPHLTVGGSLASFNGPAGNGAGPATGSMIFKELLDMLDCLFSIPALEPYLEPYIDSYIRPYTDLFDIYRQDSYPSTNGNKDDSASSSSSSTASSSVESPDENSDSSQKSAKSPPPYVTLDPIQLLWDIFRQGVPLCILFNALGRDPQLDTTIKETEKLLTERKKKVYMFVKACKDSQIVKEDQLFTTSELFKDDTNSFVRVLRTLNVVINELKANPTDSIDMAKLESRPVSWILDEGKNYPRDNRWMAVNELLNTERKYLQDLEVLQGYMHRLQGRNVVSSDTIRYMFANLNYIVDFSRRLLIRLESTACLPPPCQRFGAIFIEMEEGFAVYEPYTSNYNRANAICVDEAQVLAQMSDPIEPHYMLPSMLIKPVQRVCKYTLLLREISRHSKDTYPQSISELQEGYESVNRMVNRANESKRLEENQSIAKDLEERVEDWKGYNPGEFGVLHLYGDFKMSTSDTTRELRIYLFDEILVLVKEVAERERRRSTQSQQNRKPPPLQLKGRIFLDTIHRVVDTSREGSLSLTIYWRDVVMENFSIECTNDEQLRLWKTSMDELVAKARHKANLRHNKNTPTNDNLVITRSRAPPYSAHTPTSRFEASLNAAVAAASLSSLSSSSAGSNSAGAVAKPLQYRKTYDGSSKASSVSTVKSHKLFRSGTADPTPEHITELSKTMERALNYTTAQDQQTSVTGSALTRHKSESEAHFYKNGGASNTSTVIHDRRPSTPNFSYSMISKSAPSAPVPPLTYDTGTLHRDSSRALQLNGFLLSPAQPAPPHTAGLLEDSSYFPSTDSAVATMAVATVTSTTTASSVVAPPAVMTPQPLGLLSSIGNDNGPRSAPPSDSSFPQTTPPPLPSKSGTTRDVAKIKVHFQNDTYMLLLSLNSTYREIVEKVEKKIKICAGPRVGVISSKEEDIESSPPLDILLKYIDEDGDMITIRSDEDVQLAFVSALDARADSNAIPILNLYPTL